MQFESYNFEVKVFISRLSISTISVLRKQFKPTLTPICWTTFSTKLVELRGKSKNSTSFNTKHVPNPLTM